MNGLPVATEVSCLKPHGESIVCAVFVSGSDVLCTGSHDNTVLLWRVSDGWTCRLRGHTNWVTCLAVQASGQLLASGSVDETLRLWDLTTLLDAPDGVEVDESDCLLKNYGGAIRCCDFSASGQLLCSGSADSVLRVWRVGQQSCDLVMVLRGHKGWVMCCSFSPMDETMVASGSSDGSVRLWRADTGDCLKKMKASTRGIVSKSSREIVCCTFHPAGDLVCAGGEDKCLRLWRVHDGACMRVLQGHKGCLQGCAFQPCGGRLLASVEGNSMFGSDNSLRLWDLAGAEVTAFIPLKGHKRKVNACAYNGDGSLIATVGNDKTIRIWSLLEALHPPEDDVVKRGVEAAISEHHVQAPSQYAGSSVASLSSKDIGSEHGNISDGSGSERGRHEIERFGNGSERDGMETDSGAGVFGGEEGGDHVSAVSARSTDTHSSPRPGNGKGGVSHGEGIVGGDDELFIAGHKGKARGVGGGGNVAVGIHASANTSEGKSTSGRRDAEFVKESIQREGERGDARRDEEDGGLFVGENNKVVVSMESVGSDTLLSARQWVQLRKPWRVEARLLDLERAHAKVLQQDHLIDKELHAGAESNPVHTRSEAVDSSGAIRTFEISADFGTMEFASPSRAPPVSNPRPMEPRSTGIDMCAVDNATGQKILSPASSVQGKSWSGKLKPTPKPISLPLQPD